MRPVLFHTHGLGQYDFSELNAGSLPRIQELAEQRQLDVVLTIYLTRRGLSDYHAFLEKYARLKAADEIPSILGLSVEGPVLGPHGGVPRSSVWSPSAEEWRIIVGTPVAHPTYIVMAPDAVELDDEIGSDFIFRNLLDLVYESGSRIAVGHFDKTNASRSAGRLLSVLEYIWATSRSDRFAVLTDHLFNDMPRNFKHAWRTPAERLQRREELAQFLRQSWDPESLALVLGPVPAILLNLAKHGRLCPALNFDGEHVDLEICRQTVAYVGADNLIAMTDNIEVLTMAGEPLHLRDGSELRFRDDGVIAAGGAAAPRQIDNMRSIGLRDREIDAMLSKNPRAALDWS